MDLVKLDGLFPVNYKYTINIIGCGSVGSTIADMVARLGVSRVNLYDFDKVEYVNAPNSMLRNCDNGRYKVDAVEQYIKEINPTCEVKKYINGWKPGIYTKGVTFLCVDNIDIRRQYVKENIANENILAIFDIRTGLWDAQGYAADMCDFGQKKQLLKTMMFNHDEAAKLETSACGAALGLATTVRIICAAQIQNFINWVNDPLNLKKTILLNLKQFELETF